jgi:hypothetical protein
MSRSRKKSPVVSSGSAKLFKQQANRALRSRVKQIMRTDPYRDILPILREVSDIYDSNKDGIICYWNDKYEHIGRCGSINYWLHIFNESLDDEYKERLEKYKKALRK